MQENNPTEIKKEENLNQALSQSIEAKKDPVSVEVSKEAVQAEETPQDRDWKKWKENRKKERDEAAKIAEAKVKAENEASALRAALESLVNSPNNQSRNENYNNQSNYNEETEDQRIERRVNEALAKREQELEKQRQQREIQEYPTKIKNVYPDFNQICTQENLDYLEFHHPELAKSLSKTPESFEKWADIYNAVKRYIPNPQSSSDSKRADKNLQKPQSFQNTGLTPASTQSSARLDESRRAENWARMQKTLKGLS